ncbi:putative cyclic nucleotide-gated ion channel 19 [Cardamine amara subsp. amara]|uniref:Cyclic nucleotide-gated ion channel 19 n=1 Tax=Cardamine amara subsp. amara TaxID=228776 RepID=A0ABD1AFA2_CARAN
MASRNDNDEFPILSLQETTSSVQTRAFTSKNRSVSLLNPTLSIEGFDNSSVNLGYTGPLRTQRIRPPLVQMSGPLYSTPKPEPLSPPDSSSTNIDVPSEDVFVYKNTNLLKSGQLGMCNDPYCTTCLSYYNRHAAQFHTSRVSASRFHTALYDDARGWAKRFGSSVRRCIPGIMNPHSKFIQGWTRVLAFSSLVAIFVDPLFLFLLKIQYDNKCIEIDWRMTKILLSVKSITDIIFFINILLQFRLAYVAPEFRVVGAGQLVDHPRKIASHYLRGKYFLDLFIVLPILQVMTLWIIPEHLGTRRAESEKNIIRTIVVFQYIPKLYRLLPFLAGQTPT